MAARELTMSTDDRVQRERKREEAEYEEPGHELTKDTPGLDDVPARKIAGPDAPSEGDLEFEEPTKK
jgi:hypothetical protein